MPGGKVAEYVEGSSVIKRLNECFDNDWSFEVVREKIGDTQIVVLGRLRVISGDEFIVKEQWGGSTIAKFRGTSDVINLGNDIKAATTDSLKKCATLLGVALHLYEQDELSNTFEQIASGGGRKPAPQAPSRKESKELNDKPCNIAQQKAIKTQMSKKGLTEQELLAYLDVKSLEEISYAVASEIITGKHKCWSN